MNHLPYRCPTSVAEVVKALAGTEGARLIAGGTDLLIQLRRGAARPPLMVSLHRVEGLDQVCRDDEALRIGAGVTLARLVEDPMVTAAAPLLARAAATMASPPVRSRATIGGNLCNASPAADLAPPLLVHDAEVMVVGPSGERRLALSAFLRGPGEAALQPGELLTEVLVPPLPDSMGVGHLKHEVGVCGGLSIISLCAGLQLEPGTARCAEARVALGALAPTAVRAPEIEEALVGRELGPEELAEAARIGGRSCSPIDDVRASCDHRCHLVEVLLPRVLAEAAGLRTGRAGR